jgi:hypothetical protein
MDSLSRQAQQLGLRLPNSAALDRPALDLSAMAAWAQSKAKLDASSSTILPPDQKNKARALLGEDLDLDLLVTPQARQIESLPYIPQPTLSSESKTAPVITSSSSSSSSYEDLTTILRRQHNGIVYAACEDLETSLSIQSSAWLSRRAAEEWERSKELLAQMLGLPQTHVPTSSSSSASSSSSGYHVKSSGGGGDFKTPSAQATGYNRYTQEGGRGGGAAFTPQQSLSMTSNTITKGINNNGPPAAVPTNANISFPSDYSQVMANSTVRLAEGFINGQARLRPVTMLGKDSSDFRRREGESMRVSEFPYIRLWTLLHQVLSHEEALAEASPRSAPLWTQWAITGSSHEQQQRARHVLDAVDLDNPLSDLQLFGASRSTDVMLDRWSFKSLQYLQDVYRETRDNSGSSGGAGSPTINYVTQHLNWLARSGVSRDLTSSLLNSKQQFEAPVLGRDAQFGLFPCLFFLLRRGSVDEAAQCANDAARAAYTRRTPSDLLDSIAYALEAYRAFFDRAKSPSADRHLSASTNAGQSQWGSSSLHTSVHLGGSTLSASVQFDVKSLKHIDMCRKRALDQEASLLNNNRSIGGGGGERQHHCPFQQAVLHMLGGDASMLSPSHDHPLYAIVLSSSSLLPALRQQALQDGGVFSLSSRADTDELKLELSWFRLWFAATNKVASSSAAAVSQSSSSVSQLSSFSSISGIRSSSSLTPSSCSLLDVGAITIEETEAQMQTYLSASRMGQSTSSSSSSSSSSSTFSALSAYATCERLILAGQPEYALAFLATHGNGEAGRGLHDALHLALALSWHGALRTYPVSLARKKALFSGDKEASTADVLAERMKTEAGTEIAGRGARVGKYLLYSVRSRRQQGLVDTAVTSSSHPVHVLDLPFLMEHYFSRILHPIDASALALKENAYVKACYAALLPHAASRVALTSEQSLMLFPELALELFVKPMEIVRGGPSSRNVEEAEETLYSSALLSKEAGSFLNAVLLFRYISVLKKNTDGVIDGLKIATTELAKIASLPWATITEGRLLHRGILTLPQADLREKESLRAGLLQALADIQQSLLHIVAQDSQGELREWQMHSQRVTSMCEFYDIVASKNANQLWDSSGLLLLNRLSGGLLFPNVDEVNLRSSWKILLESLPLDLKRAYDDLLFASATYIRFVQQTQQKTVSSKFRPFVKMLQQAKSVLDELSITLSPSTREKLSEIDSNAL